MTCGEFLLLVVIPIDHHVQTDERFRESQEK